MAVENTPRAGLAELSVSAMDIGAATARYGLVIVIAWIGALKFTAFEAHGIEPLVSQSPLLSWVYGIFTVGTFSALLGVVELLTALLLAIKPWLPRVSLLGSVLAVGLFTTTLTFLVTTPGVFEGSEGGFPVLSSTGQFLIKDVALLGVALWTATDAVRATIPTSNSR